MAQTIIDFTDNLDASTVLAGVQVERPAELGFGRNFAGELESASYWQSDAGNNLFTLNFRMADSTVKPVIVKATIVKGIFADNKITAEVLKAGMKFSTGRNASAIKVSLN